jgi:hypothetical protein
MLQYLEQNKRPSKHEVEPLSTQQRLSLCTILNALTFNLQRRNLPTNLNNSKLHLCLQQFFSDLSFPCVCFLVYLTTLSKERRSE